MKRLIDVYVYRIRDEEPQFLLLKRSEAKIYARQWRMIGGKVRDEETSWQAALRELREETGFQPKSFWALPSVNTFYEPKTDSVHHIPAFAAEIASHEEPVLDDEHIGYEWIYARQVKAYLHWPEQIRLLTMAADLISNHKILPEWYVSHS